MRRFLAAVACGLCGVVAHAEEAFTLSSPAFVDGGEIPKVYTCEGEDASPPLSWRGVPPRTQSLALVVDDPDAPDPAAPRMTWVHWLVYDIPPFATGLNAGLGDKLPGGMRLGTNDFERTRWGGPCPPVGRHRYHFKLYALARKFDTLLKAPDKATLEAAIHDHVLGQATLIGTYQKTQ